MCLDLVSARFAVRLADSAGPVWPDGSVCERNRCVNGGGGGGTHTRTVGPPRRHSQEMKGGGAASGELAATQGPRTQGRLFGDHLTQQQRGESSALRREPRAAAHPVDMAAND